MQNSSRLFVSVIIPVYNDGERLKICLAALAKQTYNHAHFEVIVVDNGSSQVDSVKVAIEPYDNVVLAVEATQGSYAARNKGLMLARGEVIAFTDADCIPAPEWMERGIELLLSTARCGLVAGDIRVFFRNPEEPTSVELFEKITAFKQKEYVEKHHYGATANLFTFKSVIDHVGPFNTKLKSSGDKEWGQRVAAYNYRQVYAANAVVDHPARHSFQQIYRRTARIVGGSHDLQSRVLQSNRALLKAFLADLLPPVNFTVSAFRNLQLKSFQERIKVSFVMIFVRYMSAWERMRLILGGVSIRE